MKTILIILFFSGHVGFDIDLIKTNLEQTHLLALNQTSLETESLADSTLIKPGSAQRQKGQSQVSPVVLFSLLGMMVALTIFYFVAKRKLRKNKF